MVSQLKVQNLLQEHSKLYFASIRYLLWLGLPPPMARLIFSFICKASLEFA